MRVVTDEDPLRILLAVVAVIQIVISLPYGKKAKAGSTIFRRREPRFLTLQRRGSTNPLNDSDQACLLKIGSLSKAIALTISRSLSLSGVSAPD